MKTTHEQALARYHAAYDNVIYTHIRLRVTADAIGADAIGADTIGADADFARHADDTAVVDFMNTLIDVCLECCGSNRHSGAHIRLARLASWTKLSQATINTVYQYLLLFQRAGISAAEDFESIAKGLARVYVGQMEVSMAAAHANGVHSWQGRAAYQLLVAAEYLAKSAELLLERHDDDAYLREKLKHGLNRITGALYEGVRYADKPALFEFNGTYFPRETDG